MSRWIVPALLVVVIGGLIGWRLHAKRVEAAAQDQQRAMRSKAAPVVEVAPAAVRDIVHTFQGIGSVESPLNVKVSAKITGRIDYLQVHEGDHVTAGQVLVRIDPSEVQADLRQKMADVATARSRLAQ